MLVGLRSSLIKKAGLLIFLFLFFLAQVQAQNTPWKLARGTEGLRIAGVDVYERDPDTLYAIGQCTLRSTDGGDSWDSVSSFGSDIGPVKIDPLDSRTIFTAGVWAIDPDFSFSYVSRNGGLSWHGIFLTLSRYETGSVIEFDPADPRTIYIGNGPATLWRSTDGGYTWDSLSVPPDGISCLAISAVDDNTMYLGNTKGVLKTTDGGGTWKQVRFSFNVYNVSSIAVDPTGADIVYAGVFSFGATPGGVYKSTDGGKTWSPKNNDTDTTDQSVGILSINPKNPDQIFRAFSGPYSPKHLMFVSTDGGNTWLNCDQGLSQSGGVTSIAIDTTKNRVYVGTPSGVYINDSVLINVYNPPGTPTAFELCQNYPNPFNPTTSIIFDIPKPGQIYLTVYNVLGQKVVELVDRPMGLGKYLVEFDASRLSSGVYFYTLRVGSYMMTKKMMVLK